MKKSFALSLMALMLVAVLATACAKKETTILTGTEVSETVATDTYTDTGMMGTDTSMTGTTDTSMTSTMDTSMTSTTETSMTSTTTTTTP